MEKIIEIENVCKSYLNNVQVLKDISLTVRKNELVVLLGESGCGKTTMLKLLNCIESKDSGTIKIEGKDTSTLDPIALRRRIGCVVQQVGLFPHMTIKENIEIVNKICKLPKDQIEERTMRVMQMVGMDPDEYLGRYPNELSGGQAQRIGVARAYASDPEIVLMDEPFSALDPITRKVLQRELLDLQKKYPKTIVFVTHDIEEAILLADRIVLLNQGHIEQIGTPRELLLTPKSDYVSRFLGEKRIWNSHWLIQCKDVMSENISSIAETDTVASAWDLFEKDQTQAVLVLNDAGIAVGKLTEKILMRHVNDTVVHDAMKENFDYVYESTPLHDAVSLMNEKNILYLPVVDDQCHPKGMINMPDLMFIFDRNVLGALKEG